MVLTDSTIWYCKEAMNRKHIIVGTKESLYWCVYLEDALGDRKPIRLIRTVRKDIAQDFATHLQQEVE